MLTDDVKNVQRLSGDPKQLFEELTNSLEMRETKIDNTIVELKDKANYVSPERFSRMEAQLEYLQKQFQLVYFRSNPHAFSSPLQAEYGMRPQQDRVPLQAESGPSDQIARENSFLAGAVERAGQVNVGSGLDFMPAI